MIRLLYKLVIPPSPPQMLQSVLEYGGTLAYLLKTVSDNINKARRAFFALGRLGAFQGDLNPLSSCSIFETCITPILLYSSETWLLDSTSLDALESFQHDIGCCILRVPKFYSKLAVRIALHWPKAATRILIRKLGFLSKLLSERRTPSATGFLPHLL